jgi:hypothetical protein
MIRDVMDHGAQEQGEERSIVKKRGRNQTINPTYPYLPKVVESDDAIF